MSPNSNGAAAAVEEKKAKEEEKKEEKKPLKFLFVSYEGLIGDLAWEVKKEGSEVKYYIRDKSEKDVCDGFVDKCDDWKEFKDWADVIVLDDIEFGQIAEDLRKEGKLVVGGSLYTDKLEEDREFGQDELSKIGVNTLPHWDFLSFDDAIAFVKKNPDRYVIKPSGRAQNEKELTFVGQEEDGNDIINVLEHYEKSWSKKISAIQLQKFVQGVEVAVGVFFNGKEFVNPIFINFEHKKLFPGGLGPNCGEMGTTGMWCPPNKLFNETLAKMKEVLAASGYVGYFDLNCIVNSRGIFPLEFTARPGYPTISLQIEGITSRWSEFLRSLAAGEATELKTKKGFQICIVVAVPPFPFTDPAAFKRQSEDAIVIFKKPNLDGVHLGDVKLVEDDWRLAGQSGYAVIVTGSGITMDDASKQAYSRVKNIMIPNMFYRTDIGVKWAQEGDMLYTWGYLY
jgi:phosphoribosylamine--glycine ligase